LELLQTVHYKTCTGYFSLRQNGGYDVFNGVIRSRGTQLQFDTRLVLETRLILVTRLLLEVLRYLIYFVYFVSVQKLLNINELGLIISDLSDLFFKISFQYKTCSM